MSNFQDVYKSSGLADLFAASPYAKWGTFSEETAITVLRICKLENLWRPAEPNSFNYLRADAFAHTWMNENVFRFFPRPNMNNQPQNPDAWDAGPIATNVHWSRAQITKGEIVGFSEDKMFGNLVLDSDGKPAYFDGDPIVNLRVGARKLIVIHPAHHVDREEDLWSAVKSYYVTGTNGWDLKTPDPSSVDWSQFLDAVWEERVTHYTGPLAQPYRRQTWREYQPIFNTFFAEYQPD